MSATISIDQLIEETELPRRLGNLVLALKACAEAFPDASRAEQRTLFAHIRALCRAARERGSETEMATLRSILERLSVADALQTERVAALALLDPLAASLPAGVVNVLFSTRRPFQGRPFGVVHTLRVADEPWGGARTLSHGDEVLRTAFYRGVRVALDYLYRNGLGTLDSSIVLSGRSVHGEFPTLTDEFVTGDSLGLASAVAVLSALLDMPVPETDAFTGAVDLDGAVRDVGPLEPKLEAARDSGLTRVFCPRAGFRENAPPDLPVPPLAILVDTVDQAVEQIFDRDALDIAFGRLKSFPLAPEAREWRERLFRVKDDSDPAVPRVLVSAVGGRDPIGAPYDRPDLKEDGPILAICAEKRPDHVWLLHTPGAFARKAEEVRQQIHERYPESTVSLLPLERVSDPTDFSALFPAFRDHILTLVKDLDRKPTVVYTNVSSGTPQMDVALHLIVERGILPDYRLQVRPTQFTPAGESRVRQVVLPVL